MTITDSRLKNGRLTLGVGADIIEVACQTKNVSIDPDQDGGDDRIEVLCGDVTSGAATASDTLHIENIQDFTDPAGVQAWLWRNRGRVATFTWLANKNFPAATWTGEVTVVAPQVGGEVGAQLDYSLDLPIVKHTSPFDGFGTGQIDPGGIIVATGITAPAAGSLVWTLTPLAATLPADLTALKGHAIVGDSGSAKPTRDFTAGEYILLGDGSKAHYAATGGWAAGALPLKATDLQPPTSPALEWTLLPAGADLPVNLAALKADAAIGDGGTASGLAGAFGTGEFLTLGDGSKAHYTGTVWEAGAAT